MISCQDFRVRFAPATDDLELLAHLRSCDACLDHAIHVDPDAMFRAIGGSEMIPPGGVDAFVEGVMTAVDLRSKERRSIPAASSGWRRLSIAAAVTFMLSGAALVSWRDAQAPQQPFPQSAIASARAARPRSTTNSSVDTYSSPDATIIEVSGSSPKDASVVMVIDDKLPADL